MDSDTLPESFDYRYEAMESTILEFASHFPADALPDGRGTPELFCALLEKFWFNPSQSEARAWGDHLVEVDQLSTMSVPLASPLTIRDCTNQLICRYSPPHPWYWLAASLLLSSVLTASFFQSATNVRCKLRKVKGLLSRFR